MTQPRAPDLAEEIAAYGARLGIVEPLFLATAAHIPELTAIMEELRARKDYALSDRLRTVITAMRKSASYAFPGEFR
jgi:hypothetical protein